jgi:hypothetical protein
MFKDEEDDEEDEEDDDEEENVTWFLAIELMYSSGSQVPTMSFE